MDELKEQIIEVRRKTKSINIIDYCWFSFVLCFCIWDFWKINYPFERFIVGFILLLNISAFFITYKYAGLRPDPLKEDYSESSLIKYFSSHCERELLLGKMIVFTYIVPFIYAFSLDMYLSSSIGLKVWFWIYIGLGYMMFITGIAMHEYYANYFEKKLSWLDDYIYKKDK